MQSGFTRKESPHRDALLRENKIKAKQLEYSCWSLDLGLLNGGKYYKVHKVRNPKKEIIYTNIYIPIIYYDIVAMSW